MLLFVFFILYQPQILKNPQFHILTQNISPKTKKSSCWIRFEVQKGWQKYIAGATRRFASYMKLRLTSNGADSKDKKHDKDKDKVKSLATVSPMRKNFISNNFAQPSSLPTQFSSNNQISNVSPNHYGITGIDRRHRSPDPPPRLTRGQQSPLLLRHKLQLAQSGSPLMQRRWVWFLLLFQKGC